MTATVGPIEEVMPTAETRTQLSRIVSGFRENGAAAGVVVFGSHRKSEAAILPIAVYEALSDQINELVANARLADRLAEPDDGTRSTTDEVAARLGVELD